MDAQGRRTKQPNGADGGGQADQENCQPVEAIRTERNRSARRVPFTKNKQPRLGHWPPPPRPNYSEINKKKTTRERKDQPAETSTFARFLSWTC